ncbi:MAG: fibronectin type III-like domain-contianing protein, partial [Muribaculaceae bacterium]|nr:fibronectin type III-like domain-contianing protein [Muribaculaceae bacterium]
RPGETQAVSITIGRDALSYFDDRQHQWVAEPGDFIARIGTASDAIAANLRFKLK